MNPETRTYDKHWLPWLKTKLEEKSVSTMIPLMPKPWFPNYESYKVVMDAQDVNSDTVLVGTSCGTAFLVRWLGDTKKKIRKLILVAPWNLPWGNLELTKKFLDYDIDTSIVDRLNEVVIFTSDDEAELGKESTLIFEKALGARVIELSGMGHYVYSDMGTNELPELLDEVLNS